MGAVTAVARVELRRRWRALLVLGALAGLTGGVVVGAVAVARRTSTAPERLAAASHPPDARVMVFDGIDVARDVAALPAVEQAWVTGMHVGRLAGGDVAYLAIAAGDPPSDDLFTPVVVRGRPADDARADEVTIVEEVADALDVDVGDVLTLDLLTAEEVAQFDIGFGDPDGPTVELTVTGVVRVAGSDGVGPLFATPAFAGTHTASRAGSHVLVRLGGSHDDLAAEVAALAPPASAPGAEEFPPLSVTRPDPQPASVSASARVLTSGLLVFAAVAAAVGLLVVAQAFGRLHGAGASDQQVEAAIGLTAAERSAGRALPAVPAGLVAGATAAAAGLGAARLEPLGALRSVEPHPGWAPNMAIVTAGATAVAALVVLVAALSAWRAGRPAQVRPTRPPVTPRAVSHRAWSLAGLALLRARGVPVRSSAVGIVVGLAGAVAALAFAAGVDRLANEPVRYGWPADFAVIDATDEIVDVLRDDPRIERIALLRTTTMSVAGDEVAAYAITDVEGTTSWTMLEGRPPASSAEIVVGRPVARRLGVEVGDRVEGFTLVGIGLGPTMNGEVVGDQALLTSEGLARAARSQPFREALVAVGRGVDEEAVTDEYAASYEVVRDDPPREVQDLLGLGRLPEVLAGFLLAVAVLALGHTLVVATRRRRRDIAVLRAIGFTPGQAGLAVAAAGGVLVLGALAMAVPLGLGLGRLVWWYAATGVGVGPDLAEPWWPLALLAPGALLAVVAVAAVPARRATTVHPALALRAE